MKKIKKVVLEKLQKIIDFNYNSFFSRNILFITTALTLLFNSSMLRYFTVKNYFEIKPIVADIAIILFLSSFAYLFKPKKQITYFMTISIILTIICFVNSVYYTFYDSFASVSLLVTSLQAKDVGDAILKNILQVKDFVFLLQPAIIYFVYKNLKKNMYYIVEKVDYGKKKAIKTLIVSFVIFILFFSSLTGVELSRLNNQWNREFLVMKIGVYTYQLNDIIRSLEPRIHSFFGYDEVAKKITEYYNTREFNLKKNKYTNIFKGKNIITIHAESIQSFTMDLKFHDQELTPNLNRIASEGMNFTNFYAQVGVGTSSDSEFTLNTSLLPVSTGTVFVSYWDREFVTIPKLLKDHNYYSFSMHGNTGAFWNRITMHREMGYDRFYHKADFVIDEEIGLGLSDKSFFRQAVPIIKEIDEKHENFYGTMITLTNHTPFDEIEAYGNFPVDMEIEIINDEGRKEIVTVPYMEETRLGNYLKAVHYADAAIGQFISEMDEVGLLDNTVIVIYGDHDARLPRRDYVRLYNYDPYTDSVLSSEHEDYIPVDYYTYEINRKVPFIIWTKDGSIRGTANEVMGMYDVLPTLGNMFGFYSPYQLGNDIFSVKDNVVVFPNGNWLTNKIYYNNQKEEYLLLKEDVISQEYLDRYIKHAQDLLEISNNIVIFDYIKRQKETELLMQEYERR